MLLTRAAAVGIVFAVGEEGAENAVLHMEHRHVLMNGDIKPVARCAFQ